MRLGGGAGGTNKHAQERYVKRMRQVATVKQMAEKDFRYLICKREVVIVA